jgi:hypothetical protein
MAGETSLVISGQGASPYASRGITARLEPIAAAGNFRRTVNSTLINLSPTQFQTKYRGTLSGTDQDSPAFDAVDVGDTLTIGWPDELSYLTSGGSPAKTVVSGSSVVSGNYTFYRPQFVMMVVAKRQERDETGWVQSWELDLEEV